MIKKMKSELSIDEFRARLSKLVKEGEPWLMGTPLAIMTVNSSNKPFFGEFTKTKFNITKNASLIPTPYILRGEYSVLSNLETSVSYQIKPIWFGYLWVRIVPAITLIIANIVFIKNADVIPTSIFFASNIFFLTLGLPILLTIKLKNQMERDFLGKFEIVKP